VANDEMIAHGIRHLPKIKVYDILPFHFLDTFYYGIHQKGSSALCFLHPVILVRSKVQSYFRRFWQLWQ